MAPSFLRVKLQSEDVFPKFSNFLLSLSSPLPPISLVHEELM